jgi:hypothetical protein
MGYPRARLPRAWNSSIIATIFAPISRGQADRTFAEREQAFFLKAIREDLDLTDWMNDAVNSLRIVLAADESIRTGRAVEL